MKIVERLDEQSVVDENGDVRSIADVNDLETGRIMTDRARIARMHPRSDYSALAEADVQRRDSMEMIRNLADFAQRNETLHQMAGKVGEENRHIGASEQLASGHYIKGYRNADHAAELAARSKAEARRLGEEACAACPLAEYCDTTADAVAANLQLATTRNRFKHRVEHAENDHLCETNLKPGRQKNSIA